MNHQARHRRTPMNITIADLALVAIAVALWLALIIGWNGI